MQRLDLYRYDYEEVYIRTKLLKNSIHLSLTWERRTSLVFLCQFGKSAMPTTTACSLCYSLQIPTAMAGLRKVNL